MNRTQWKAAYRQLRILRREALKASHDAFKYGTGFVRFVGNTVEYVSIDEVRVLPLLEQPR